jgi:hypothetical protein
VNVGVNLEGNGLFQIVALFYFSLSNGGRGLSAGVQKRAVDKNTARLPPREFDLREAVRLGDRVFRQDGRVLRRDGDKGGIVGQDRSGERVDAEDSRWSHPYRNLISGHDADAGYRVVGHLGSSGDALWYEDRRDVVHR